MSPLHRPWCHHQIVVRQTKEQLNWAEWVCQNMQSFWSVRLCGKARVTGEHFLLRWWWTWSGRGSFPATLDPASPHFRFDSRCFLLWAHHDVLNTIVGLVILHRGNSWIRSPCRGLKLHSLPPHFLIWRVQSSFKHHDQNTSRKKRTELKTEGNVQQQRRNQFQRKVVPSELCSWSFIWGSFDAFWWVLTWKHLFTYKNNLFKTKFLVTLKGLNNRCKKQHDESMILTLGLCRPQRVCHSFQVIWGRSLLEVGHFQWPTGTKHLQASRMKNMKTPLSWSR